MIVWKKEFGNKNWSNEPTTFDQTNIVEYLKTIKDHKELLHIGIGNSSLALQLKSFKIDGITISQEEVDFAVKMNLSKYNVFLCDKYSNKFLEIFELKKYDYIVDNNLFNYSDCNTCNLNILFFYIKLLKENGEILTHTMGLRWRKDQTSEDLEKIVYQNRMPLLIKKCPEDKNNDYVIRLIRK